MSGANERITFPIDPRASWRLLHLEVGIDCLAAQSELTGNVGHVDLFGRKIVNAVIAFDAFLMELQALFFHSFGHACMEGGPTPTAKRLRMLLLGKALPTF